MVFQKRRKTDTWEVWMDNLHAGIHQSRHLKTVMWIRADEPSGKTIISLNTPPSQAV